jgi:hypothetical protein
MMSRAARKAWVAIVIRHDGAAAIDWAVTLVAAGREPRRLVELASMSGETYLHDVSDAFHDALVEVGEGAAADLAEGLHYAEDVSVDVLAGTVSGRQAAWEMVRLSLVFDGPPELAAWAAADDDYALADSGVLTSAEADTRTKSTATTYLANRRHAPTG